MQALILTFVIPAIAMIFAAVFAGLWWQDRARLHIAAYAYCYLTVCLGVIINISIFGAVGPLGIVSYHLLCMSGLIALFWGAAKRVGLKTPIWAYSATVVFTSAILWGAAVAQEQEAMRIAQNVNSSLLMALAAQNLWYAGSRRIADRAVVWILGMFSGFGLTLPVMSVFSEQLFGPGEKGQALLFAFHVLVLAVFLTLQAIALIATILGDKSEAERETAALDPLSGLPMRAMFESEARALQEQARDRGEPVSLIIADLDNFKRINDTLGHAAGDRVIAAFGQMIASEIRPHDMCGRIGGEEFCIVASRCEGSNAKSLANRVRVATRRLSVPGVSPQIAVTASFGIAKWDPHEAYKDVFERADAALYNAKHSGRDRVVMAQADADEEPDPALPIFANNQGDEPASDGESDTPPSRRTMFGSL